MLVVVGGLLEHVFQKAFAIKHKPCRDKIHSYFISNHLGYQIKNFLSSQITFLFYVTIKISRKCLCKDMGGSSLLLYFHLLMSFGFLPCHEVKVTVLVLSHVLLYVTQWTIALQAPLSLGFSRQEYWKWVTISFSRSSSQPRQWTRVSHIPSRFSTVWATKRSPLFCLNCNKTKHKMEDIGSFLNNSAITYSFILTSQN